MFSLFLKKIRREVKMLFKSAAMFDFFKAVKRSFIMELFTVIFAVRSKRIHS